MAADWTTAVIAATATMFFQAVSGGVRLFLAKRKERRDAVRKLLSVLTMLEWEFDHEARTIDLHATVTVLPKTRARLLEFLAAIGEARAVLTEPQVDAALALHLAIEEEMLAVEHYSAGGSELWAITMAFLAAMGSKSQIGTRIRAIASKARIEMEVDAREAATPTKQLQHPPTSAAEGPPPPETAA